jgi:hypothetical protein
MEIKSKIIGSHAPSQEHAAVHSYISWKAIFAGVLVAFVVNMLLMALGAGIGGAASVGLAREGDGAAGLAAGAGIWIAVACLLSLFAGGFFATRASTFITPTGGGAHGFLIAAIFFAVAIYGAGATIGAAGRGISSMAGSVAEGAGNLADNPAVQNVVERSLGDVKLRSDSATVAKNLSVFLIRGDETAAKNYLAYQSGLAPAEVDARLAALRTEFEARTKEILAATAQAVSAAGWTLFVTMFLGLAAAIFGGIQGARENVKHPLVAETHIGSYQTSSVTT